MARVGYYDAVRGEGLDYQVDEIEASGHTAIKMETLSAAELAGIDVLYVLNPSNGGWPAEFREAQSRLTTAVENGLHLFVGDRRVTEAAEILPGGADIVFVRIPGLRDVHLDPEVPQVFLDGVGGPITESTYDYGTSSGHGYATRASLPDGAVPILTHPDADQILNFAYPLGQGGVYYTAIPLDYYSVREESGIKPFEVTLLLSTVISGLENGGIIPGLTLVGTNDAETLTGDRGPDTLNGLGGDDVLLGLGGRDLLDGGTGADTMTGGAGNDRYIVDSRSDVIVELLGGGTRDQAEASVDYTLPDYVERLLLTGSGNVNATGNADANILTGNAGNNHLRGLDGDDWLNASLGGNDTLDGGGGTDTATFAQLSHFGIRSWRLEADLTTGQADTGAHTAQLIGIENLSGTAGQDILRGDAGDNVLRGLTSNDWLQGRGGNDTLDGGHGFDIVSYVGDSPRLVADLGAGWVRSGTAIDHLISIEGLVGSRFSDVITIGHGGAEVRGKAGNEWVVAGRGIDVIDGGAHVDTVSYAGNIGGISASLQHGRGWTGAAAGDRYWNVENLTGTGYNDRLSGNDDRNILRGMTGDDFLFGYAGEDVLTGGAGDDMLYGGTGTDWAVFSGNLADYTLTRTSLTDMTVVGPDGSDGLFSVEYLRFDDATTSIWDLAIA